MMSEDSKQVLLWIYENRSAATMPALVAQFGYRAYSAVDELVRRGMLTGPTRNNVIPFPARRSA